MGLMTGQREGHLAALSLGGNVGDVAAAFAQALAELNATQGVRVAAASGIWRTPPWGKTDQADFLNMAALVETTLDAHALLALCQRIEREAGRERHERWGPRTLDLDLIAFDDVVSDEAALILPHPRAHERAFVLVPLAEIAPDLRLPQGRVGDLAGRCDRSGMSREA